MQTLTFCPRWGAEALSADSFVQRVAQTGYDGIEIAVIDPELDRVLGLAKDAGLQVVVQHWDVDERDLAVHLRRLEERLRQAAAHRPLFINSHTGRDCFTLDENLRVFDLAEMVSAETGVPIHHETHRHRCFHSPWRTLEVLKARPSLGVTLDMSHWCAVCETLLGDLDDLMEQVVPNVRYIHARVGWAQGPQVSDPRAPEWHEAVAAHTRWWKRVLAARRAAGDRAFAVAPEFGPQPYLPTLPYTNQPVADQWAINAYMRELVMGLEG